MQLSLTLFAVLAVLAPVQTVPAIGFQKQNGLDAQKLNAQFATIKASDSCQGDATAFISGGFAQCVQGQWQVTPCAGGTSCYALPLVNKVGTALSCDTESDALARFAAAGVTGGITGNDSTSVSDSGSDGEDTDCDDDEDAEDDGGVGYR